MIRPVRWWGQRSTSVALTPTSCGKTSITLAGGPARGRHLRFPWVRGRHRSLRATASPPPFRSVDIERRAAVILPLLGDTSAGGGWSGRCSHIPSRKILRHTGSGLWGCVERFAARPSAACPWNLWALSKSRIPPYPGTVCQKGVSGGGHTEVHFERRCH